MRKALGILLAVMLLAAGCAAGEETARLPESRYALRLPEGMIYDGPTEGTREVCAYLSGEMGLEVHVFRYDTGMTDVIAQALAAGATDMGMTAVNGIQMMTFRFPAEEDGWQGVSYILEDGDGTTEIRFWYSTQEAADMTKTIMESIEDTETV